MGVGLYTFGTHEQKLYQLDHATESLAQSAFSRSINPYSNETLSDIHIARIPLTQLPSELLKDYRRGGSRLVETYCAGLLGGWGECAFLTGGRPHLANHDSFWHPTTTCTVKKPCKLK